MLKTKSVIFNLLIVALGVNTLSLSFSHAAKTTTGCERKFVDGTEGLKSYLSMLIKNQHVADEDLKRFKESLQAGKLINPISEQQASVDPVLLIHRGGLEKEYFQNKKIKIEQKKLLTWVSNFLQIKEKEKADRNQTKNETEVPFRKMILQKIPKGSFKMGEEKDIPVELTHDFYMTDTHITQAQWVELMGENPSEFKEGKNSVTIQVNGKNIRFQLDHPVENVSWWSVLEFANRLSIKHGLKPVYDLSKVQFQEDTKAEDGSWQALDEKEAAKLLKINSSSEDFTGTEGYRLATEAEYEYVLTNLGTSKGLYFFGDSEEELKDYAWIDKNSEVKTHAVAEKKAFLIKDQAFYDLHGNVWSWVWGWKEDLKCGKDPIGSQTGFYRVLRGGDWLLSGSQYLRSAYRFFILPTYRSDNAGFRLVRTVQP